MFTISASPILGLHVIRPYIFKDFRGEYTETYEANTAYTFGKIDFVQDSVILSHKAVLRGYHGDNRTNKLISCLQGTFQITFVCIDPDDKNFMKSETMILDDKERIMVMLPPKYVNAHQCLTDTCLFFYKQDTYYLGEKYQYSIKWDSISGTVWAYPPVLSQRDKLRGKYAFDYIEDDGFGNVRRLKGPEEVNG